MFGVCRSLIVGCLLDVCGVMVVVFVRLSCVVLCIARCCWLLLVVC